MARATKTKKNGKTKAPKSGVEMTEDGPVYIETIPEAEQVVLGKVLADKCMALENLEADWRIESAAHRGEVKDLKKEIKALREEVQTGTRKKPAQHSLPHTEPDAVLEAEANA